MDSATLYIVASVAIPALAFLLHRRLRSDSRIKKEKSKYIYLRTNSEVKYKNEAPDKPAKSTISCPHCSAKTARYSLFCAVCGKPTIKNPEVEPRPLKPLADFNSKSFNRTLQQNSQDSQGHNVEDYSFDIVGESNYQHALSAIAGKKQQHGKQHFCIAEIYREPNNPYDKYACVVEINNQKVGYISKNDNKDLIKSVSEHGFPIKLPAVIVGGWEDAKSTGSYGVKLKPPRPDLKVSQSIATTEQKEMFKYIEGKLPRNLSHDQFKKQLMVWKKELPDKYSQWEFLEDVLEQLSDKDVLYEHGIKRVAKKDTVDAFNALVADGVDIEDISADLDIIVDHLIKTNPSIKQ